ncbi:MAG: 30S ribosome-binding factor RbfA [Planctomycetota bacterium]
MTHRIEQAESTLRKALAQVLQRRISDPRIRGLVSITHLDISPDLKNAKVYISVLPGEFEKRTVAGLRAADRHIQNEVKKLVALRVVPHLQFELDSSLKRADAVFDAMSQDPAGPTGPDSEDDE